GDRKKEGVDSGAGEGDGEIAVKRALVYRAGISIEAGRQIHCQGDHSRAALSLFVDEAKKVTHTGFKGTRVASAKECINDDIGMGEVIAYCVQLVVDGDRLGAYLESTLLPQIEGDLDAPLGERARHHKPV